ncbi:MAG: RnfABCDGE type electron transport complex subunit D [Bacilli bacterium]
MNKVVTKKGPFIKDNNSTFKIMRNLFIALLPIILFSFYKNGYLPYKNKDVGISGLFYPLVFIILPALNGFIIELFWSKFILKRDGIEVLNTVKSSFSIFPGLFLGLILPMNTPLLIVILGSFFATVIGKLIYGGFGNNIFNPALVGRLFIISTYALTIVNNGGYLNASELDAITKATPLSNIVSGIGSYETLVKPYGSLMNFFIGTIPGSMGETSALLCLIGLIYLLFTKVIKWIIPFTYIITVFIITYFIGTINGVGIWYPLFQILSGGLMFGAIFMATDPVTSPVTKIGQTLYGLLLGLLTVIFRYLTPFPEGVLTSILTMNMLVLILDKIGFKARFKKKYIFIPLTIVIILIATISLYIGTTFSKPKSDFNIISKTKKNNITTYIVTNKGYSSDIKAKIELKDNKILKYEIIYQNDSFYKTIENNDYINKLIKNQNAINEMDTVSGATVTSTALKKILLNVIYDYTNGKGFIKEDIIKEPEFQIIDKDIINNKTLYTVSQKSFSGKIKLIVTVIEKKITEIQVLETNDSYFEKIKDSNYITDLVINQNNLKDLDTIAGATISSNSLKKAINGLLDYIMVN